MGSHVNDLTFPERPREKRTVDRFLKSKHAGDGLIEAGDGIGRGTDGFGRALDRGDGVIDVIDLRPRCSLRLRLWIGERQNQESRSEYAGPKTGGSCRVAVNRTVF